MPNNPGSRRVGSTRTASANKVQRGGVVDAKLQLAAASPIAGGDPGTTGTTVVVGGVDGIGGTANEIDTDSVTGFVTLSLAAALVFTGKTIQDGTYHDGVFNGSLGTTLPSTAVCTTVKVTNAAGFISSDGSTGFTGTVTTGSLVGKTITIKDGIITGFA